MNTSKKTRTSQRQLRHKRCRNKISGVTQRPRMTVFFSNKHVYAQIIDDLKGSTLCSCGTSGKDMAGQVKGKPLSAAAAIVGKTIAEKAKEAGIETIVFDRSGYQYSKRLKSLCDAAREAGLVF